MREQKRDFKGVWISKEVWLDDRLNMLEKGILTEIDSLDVEETGCYASNKYLAEFCQCSETKVSTAISKLIELGYLYVKSFDGRTRILKSRLSKNERQTLNILKADIKNFKQINKDNNTDNIKYIVDYLNEMAGTRYKHTTPKTKSLINARLNEGFTLDDFKRVVDNKVLSWLKDEKMSKYLRPETLFGTKFESYLNEKVFAKQGISTHNLTKEQLDGLIDEIENIEI